VIERGYEGYVASAYEGGPTRRWLKVKQKHWTVPATSSDPTLIRIAIVGLSIV
jgi:hypothetical protein